ncbi:unnamed protein product [Tilletia controversa]|nr:unnamed protein product [Tilletia controversa]
MTADAATTSTSPAMAEKHQTQAQDSSTVLANVSTFFQQQPFGAGSFDAVYAIEATCHAPSWEGCYGQIREVLKPGGVFGLYDWCMSDEWDASNPEHKRIAHGIEIGDGIPEMRRFE